MVVKIIQNFKGPYVDQNEISEAFGEFEKIVKTAFEAKGSRVDPNFFKKLPDMGNIAYMLLCPKEGVEGYVGTMLALREHPDKGVRGLGIDDYIVLDKIAVLPEYQRNGVLADMMDVAKKIRSGTSNSQVPTLWRTADKAKSRTYEKHSQWGNACRKIDDYYIHGFGFNRQANPTLVTPNMLFKYLAGEVAARPPTVTNPAQFKN